MLGTVFYVVWNVYTKIYFVCLVLFRSNIISICTKPTSNFYQLTYCVVLLSKPPNACRNITQVLRNLWKLYLSWILKVTNIKYMSYRGYFRPNGVQFLIPSCKRNAPDFDTCFGNLCRTQTWLLEYHITMHLPQDLKYYKTLETNNPEVIFL